MATSFPANDSSDSDHKEEEQNTKENGVVQVDIDRYGFMGGSQQDDDAGGISITVLRRRELKWLTMLQNWDKHMQKKYYKVRERCRKGIPPSLRARAWQFLCGGRYLLNANKHAYSQLTAQTGNAQCTDDIQKDLHRQFPLHEIFAQKGGQGQEDLFFVLKAYSILNPEVGYCQGQAPLASVLLMHMPAEQAFWCLTAICDKYLPGYFSQHLEAIQLDGDILFGLLKKVDSGVYKHLKKQKVDPVLYMTEWFMCVFARTLPWSSVLRVWDMFLCEGVKVLFRVALVLLKFTLTGSVRKKCPSMYETLETLRRLPHDVMKEDFLIEQMNRLDLTEYDMEKEHQKQVARRRQQKLMVKNR